MQRLRGLRLLGALDYLDDHPFHTRWEHSIGVAVLAEVVGQLLELDEAQFETFSAAALLHDIGHSPLSHTLHDLLEETLGFSHRSLGVDLVLGKKSFPGVEAPLNRFLENLNVNPTDVASIILGERRLGSLLCGSFGIDTLDAISRIAWHRDFLQEALTFDLTASLEPKGRLTGQQLDKFWRLKNTVYASLVYSDRSLVFERIVVLTAIPHLIEIGEAIALMEEPAFADLIRLDHTIQKFQAGWHTMEQVRDPDHSAEVRRVVRRFVRRGSRDVGRFDVEPEERVVRVNRKTFADLVGLQAD